VVDALTERKSVAGVYQAWEVRKRDALNRLQEAGSGAAAVKAADVVHNALTLAGQLRHDGTETWRFYKRGPEQTMWYYGAVAAIAHEKLGSHPLVTELDAALRDLEQAIRDTGGP
jgi:molybdopterin-guanine dinucleotide biosynthesis protein